MLDLMIAAALAQAQPAPLWRSVHSAETGEVFVDPASLRRDGQSFDITARAVFHEVTRSGMKTGITRNRYNCARQSMLTLHVHYFDANGRTIENRAATGALTRDRPVGGRSANAAILRLYCPRRTPG